MTTSDKYEETVGKQPTARPHNNAQPNPTDRREHEGGYALQGDSGQARGRGVDHRRAHSHTAYDRGHAEHDIQKDHSDGIPEDARLRIALENELLAHENLETTNIRVEVRDSHVTLEGAVDNEEQRLLATQILQGVAGVASIENQLRVVAGLLGQMGQGSEPAENERSETDTDHVIPTRQEVTPGNRVR
jgi:hypothetical protein